MTANQKWLLFEILLVVAIALALIGCATPTLCLRRVTFCPDGKTTATLCENRQSGWQLFLGEHHDLPEASDTTKKTMGDVCGLAIIVAGMATGNVPVAAVGALASILSTSLEKPSTATATVLASKATDTATSTTLAKFQAVEKALK